MAGLVKLRHSAGRFGQYRQRANPSQRVRILVATKPANFQRRPVNCQEAVQTSPRCPSRLSWVPLLCGDDDLTTLAHCDAVGRGIHHIRSGWQHYCKLAGGIACRSDAAPRSSKDQTKWPASNVASERNYRTTSSLSCISSGTNYSNFKLPHWIRKMNPINFLHNNTPWPERAANRPPFSVNHYGSRFNSSA